MAFWGGNVRVARYVSNQQLESRGDVLETLCNRIYQQARHDFRPLLRRLGDERSVRAAIGEIISGRKVNDGESKISDLTALVIGSANAADQWQ
jgi:hypothetical protein